ncbi:polysaccharide biosynthesis tyrosine autokinase [Pelagicoccus sp. SDUM812003]|uniref:GumC family protein n=1 Tax=Pelagicoccus sp. SDUM812003 TaxID=3041267 RepID=UPI00280D386D|nr:polysaccharide biosynthesis tyrosine autokinase [Pelagicoccus sp. SDUM812003]MDQ8204652.1 polysaccharide biosynthesis tyrosine autokinase [Pelagicoccus sp. SDUM812003]
MPDTSSTSDFRNLMLAIRERWVSSALIALSVSLLLASYLLTRPAEYETSAGLLVERSKEMVLNVEQVVNTEVEQDFLDSFLSTQIEQLTTSSFLAEVAKSFSEEELELVLASYGLIPGEGPPQTNLLKTVKNEAKRYLSMLVPQTEAPPKSIEEKAASLLNETVRVGRVKDTMFVRITVTHRNPFAAQLIADRMAKVYVDGLARSNDSSIETANTFLAQKSEDLGSEIASLESRMQSYRLENNLVALKDKQNIVIERLRQLDDAHTKARLKRIELTSQRQQIDAIYQDGDLQKLAAATQSPEMMETQRELDLKLVERGVLSERYGKAHPAMIGNQDAINSLNSVLDEQAKAIHSIATLQLEKAIEDEERLREELTQVEQESLRLDELAAGYEALERQLETTKATYLKVLERKQETDLAKQLDEPNVKLVDPASLPIKPVSPNLGLVLIVSVGLGGSLFLGFPVVLASIDGRIKSYSEIGHSENRELLSEIPRSRGIRRRDRDLIVAHQSAQPVLESFRSIQSNISPAETVAFSKTYLVTSTVPGEGKTFVASNFASSCTQYGKKTLLVDADFRRPCLHKIFGLKNDRGIIPKLHNPHALVNSDPLTDPDLGLVEVQPGLWLLRSGAVSSKLLENLATSELPHLLRTLRSAFEVVILDTPPVGVFPDAEGLARYSDEILYICRFNKADSSYVQKSLARFEQRQKRFIRIIMNGMPRNRSGSSYYAGYSYAYAQKKYAY